MIIRCLLKGLESILNKEEDIQIIHRCHEGKEVFNHELLDSIDIIPPGYQSS